MNTGFDLHLTEDVLEMYVLGQLSRQDCVSAEEHLLICPDCMNRLDQCEAYIRVMKVAASIAADRSSRLPQLAPAPKVGAIASIR